MYHVGPRLKDLDRTEIHKLLDDDFEHVQTKLVFVKIGMLKCFQNELTVHYVKTRHS